MISVRDFFVEMGRSAEDRAGRLANEGAALNARERAYDGIRSQLEAAAADGRLDPQEIDALMAAIAGQGLDIKALETLGLELRGGDRAIQGDGVGKWSQAAQQILNRAEDRGAARKTMLLLEVKDAQADMEIGYGTAASTNKQEHDTAMQIIRNMAG